ncbi:hypothetical protein AB1K54_16670 [Microbacterium sp. BWT-B31]|uniref:hypothetical protein n=1 Tax=Microbacterium sp. BWT-B31 TaxID=3232072 RepID=UPI003527E525
MTDRPTLWTRIRNLISPPPENYDTRKARPSGAAPDQQLPIYEATDARRAGGTMQIGG